MYIQTLGGKVTLIQGDGFGLLTPPPICYS